MNQDDISVGTCFQQVSTQAFIWRVLRLFEAIDGRPYAVLSRIDYPCDQKTLALHGLRDRALFRLIAPAGAA